ncbi:hypothetical protein HS5_14640 [Acidianus sp. HS-5]|nr:hypothetical protein HS5_14640 [Acidianus sp. HS-5]
MKYLKEADELLEKGDIVQASEKYYKAAEEAIKTLSIYLKINPENWNLASINRVALEISKILGDDILDYWNSATALYTANLDEDTLKILIKDVKKLVEIANAKYNEVLERS